jgi:hypothetical protein
MQQSMTILVKSQCITNQASLRKIGLEIKQFETDYIIRLITLSMISLSAIIFPFLFLRTSPGSLTIFSLRILGQSICSRKYGLGFRECQEIKHVFLSVCLSIFHSVVCPSVLPSFSLSLFLSFLPSFFPSPFLSFFLSYFLFFSS